MNSLGLKPWMLICGQPRLAGAAQLVHQGPAPGRGHQNFGRAGLAVSPGILAGHVDIEGMMGVLDDGNAQALLERKRDHPRQQGGLAGAAPSREAYHFHRILRNPCRGSPS